MGQVSEDSSLRGFESEKFWLQYMIWGAQTIIESVERLKALHLDCHDKNVVPCKWPVGPEGDYDFAVVDSSGLFCPLGLAKEVKQKCAQTLRHWWDSPDSYRTKCIGTNSTRFYLQQGVRGGSGVFQG